MMNDKSIHLIGRIDQIIRDYFIANPEVNQAPAKHFMPLFIEKGIFAKDNRAGKPIRDLLRQLDAESKLEYLHNCAVIRKNSNRNWYFQRVDLFK